LTPAFLNCISIRRVLKNRLHILIILIFNSFLAEVCAQNLPKNEVIKDTIHHGKKDSLAVKESLDDIVKSSASEDIRNDVQKKMMYLNKNAKVTYQDMEVEADYLD